MTLINFLRPSVRTLKMNSDWVPLVPNQNKYTDRPSASYAYYVTLKLREIDITSFIQLIVYALLAVSET